MESKNHFSLIFLLTTAIGFIVLWLLNPVLTGFLHSEDFSEWGYFGMYLNAKIHSFGKAQVLTLLPQLKFRWLAICIFGWWLSRSADSSPNYDESLIRWRVRLFFVVQMLFIPDLLEDLNIRSRWSGFFEPPLLTGLLIREMPPLPLIQFAGLFLFGISAWLVLSKWKTGSLLPAVFALLVWLIWTFLLTVYQSGGVIDHAFASMHSAQFFMAVFLFIWWKFPSDYGLGYRLFQAGIWGCYFFAGLEKVFLSGTDWFSGNQFEMLCLHHPGNFCDWLSNHPGFSSFLLMMVLLFQILSPLQWRYPNWAFVTISAGILFHIGTWLVLNVGDWNSPWICMLFFLLPVKRRTLKA